MKFTPIAASILLALPALVNAGNITMKNGAVVMANNTPVININAANANGISHNVYDKLNVGKEGLVFNNSQNSVNTILAGSIAGNSKLASGTAKVILNEVTSRNSSALKGFMEVAGDKAHLIIANPNGISCNTCGFINADKITLTTGKPDMVNGALKGYSVNGGTITANGLYSESPTAILARSLVVNGDIRVGGDSGLTVIVGSNYVDTQNQVTRTLKGSGRKSTYSVDVSRFGGMYADKIRLISTENGVGVRNIGVLAADAGGMEINTKGYLVNNNAQIKSSGVLSLTTNGGIDNVTGKITGDQNVYIDTNKWQVNNSRAGNIKSGKDAYIDSGSFNNTNGKVIAANLLALNTNNATLTNYGKGNNVGIDAGIVFLQAGTLNNINGQIKGYNVGAKTANFNNTNGSVESYSDIDIVASTGLVNNTGGLLRGANGHVKIDATKGTLINSGTKSADTVSTDTLGIIAGEGGINIFAENINNSGGQIASFGDVGLQSTNDVYNYEGRVASSKKISVKATSLNNNHASLAGREGLDIVLSKDVSNYIGGISSEAGDVNMQVRHINNFGGLIQAQNVNLKSTNGINNNTSLIIANKKLTINTQGEVDNQNSRKFGSAFGIYFGVPNQEGGMIGRGGVDITAKNFNNSDSRIIVNGGTLTMSTTGWLSNDHGMLVADKGASSLKVGGTFNNNYATVYTVGDMTINAHSMSQWSSGSIIDNDATGMIASDGVLSVNVKGSFVNYGWLSGKQKASVSSEGTLYNRNTIFSDNEVSLRGKVALENYGDVKGDKALTVVSNGNIYNAGALFSDGTASISAPIINNVGPQGVLGGREGTKLNAKSVSGSGIFIGL